MFKTTRTNKLSNYTSFENCIESMFGKELADLISKSEHTSPESLIKNRVEVSFDDLITIWNAGILHSSTSPKNRWHNKDK